MSIPGSLVSCIYQYHIRKNNRSVDILSPIPESATVCDSSHDWVFQADFMSKLKEISFLSVGLVLPVLRSVPPFVSVRKTNMTKVREDPAPIDRNL